MHVSSAIQIIGSSGLFPSRAFFPAFATAMLLRFGHHIPVIANTGFVQGIEGSPTWFTHDITLTALAILSLVELWATKNPDVRDILVTVEGWLKAGMGLLTSLGILSASDAELVHRSMGLDAGGGTLALVSAGAVFSLSSLRRRAWDAFLHLDPDDSLGLYRYISWLEDFWVWFALLMLLLFPVLMLVLAGLVFVGLYLLGKYLERMEEKRRLPCAGCSEPIYLSAISCPKCKRPVDEPCAVGFFGQTRPGVPAGKDHGLRLIERRRCPCCATRFGRSGNTCGACGRMALATPEEVTAYERFVDRRRMWVIPICLGLSFIPVIGAVPGIVYYRLALVAPYRRYMTWSNRLVMTWVVRIVNFLILAMQWLPVVGGLSLPTMALISHAFHRHAFRRSIKGTLQQDPQVIPPAIPLAAAGKLPSASPHRVTS